MADTADVLLQLRVDQAKMPGFAERNFTAHIGVVKSWRPYGMLQIDCKQGCECESMLADLHDPSSRVTIQSMVDLELSPGDLSEPCLIDLRVSEQTNTGGHFAKVMSLGVEPIGSQSV
jgi:hypothetical protein